MLELHQVESVRACRCGNGDARPFTLQGLGKQVRWQIPMKTLYAKEAKPGKCSKSVVIHLLDELRRL
jgi:hypothetical protein